MVVLRQWSNLVGTCVAVIAAFVVSTLLTVPTYAQDLPFSIEATETCLADLPRGADRDQCVGAAAEVCRKAAEGQDAMGPCIGQELAYWTARMQASFAMAISRAESKDFDARAMNIPPQHQEDALNALQDNWNVYRESACKFEQTLWGIEDSNSATALLCQMVLVAQQTFYLEAVALVD